jgi:hypothetical protein
LCYITYGVREINKYLRWEIGIKRDIFFEHLIKIVKKLGEVHMGKFKEYLMAPLVLCLTIGMISTIDVIPLFADQAGMASYYSYECAKLPMANGRPFDPEKRTCASWFYDFGTVLEVKSLDTGKVTEVVVTDRGPNKRLVKQGRVIDLSKRAFQDICRLEKGLTSVVIKVKE